MAVGAGVAVVVTGCRVCILSLSLALLLYCSVCHSAGRARTGERAGRCSPWLTTPLFSHSKIMVVREAPTAQAGPGLSCTVVTVLNSIAVEFGRVQHSRWASPKVELRVGFASCLPVVI